MKNFVERKKCPGCSNNKFITIYERRFDSQPIKDYLISFYGEQGDFNENDIADGVFEVVECKECSLIFQLYIPNDELMQKIYENWLKPDVQYKSKIENRGLGYSMQLNRQVAMIIAYLRRSPNQISMLDFGMGWGLWPAFAGLYGCDSYGFEISQTRIDHAKSIGVKVLSYDELISKKFDFINTEQVFEHVPNPSELLKNLHKLLNPGGIIRISVPNGEGIKRKLIDANFMLKKGNRNSINPIAPLEHINSFTYKNLSYLGKKHSYDVFEMPLKYEISFIQDWRPGNWKNNFLKPIIQIFIHEPLVLYFKKR